jgi:hypothetical protein
MNQLQAVQKCGMTVFSSTSTPKQPFTAEITLVLVEYPIITIKAVVHYYCTYHYHTLSWDCL